MNWLKKLLTPKKGDTVPATPQLALARYVSRPGVRADIAIAGGAGAGKSTLLADLFQAVGEDGVKATVIVRSPSSDVWVERAKFGYLPQVTLHAYDWRRRMSAGSRDIYSAEFQALNVHIVEEAIRAAQQHASRWLIIEWVELTRDSVARVRAHRDARAPDLGLVFVVHGLEELGEAVDQLGALVAMYSARMEERAWPNWRPASELEEVQHQRNSLAPGDTLIYLRE
ncbi:hypothetical protein AB4Y45_35000 [Paraburkholderia sp. EG287A]|uniref:hypothetical protein n=1 Tax=Paraburkholderia sp. EG287A TaxID=3237012 RepID=UPI0034D2D913